MTRDSVQLELGIRGDKRSVSFLSPWRQSENFYEVLRSKIALLKMEEHRGSQGAEEHLRGERESRESDTERSGVAG